MTEAFERDAVRYEGDRPVAVGDLRLAQPTRMATTTEGFWGLYEVGDEVLVVHPGGAVRGPADQVRGRLAALADDDGRDDADREAARSFLPLLGGDDPGAAGDVPRSRVEQGPPPTYTLSDERNTPPAP
ncbi:MAG TPA: hypothetical protein VFN05_07245 [Actinomycetes bacterium]|jgi:hypothetical protein|nr:hypothetical protein [Actinomycetes bacterium]